MFFSEADYLVYDEMTVTARVRLYFLTYSLDD